MKRPAFTLIELLVVVAIVALLCSILLPSLHRARAQARQTLCATNLNSIGVALYNYWTEWNGALPYVWSPMTNNCFGRAEKSDAETDPFDRTLWPDSLPNVLMPMHMAEMPQVFVCPEAVNGWPRQSGTWRYTYREASVNQPNGVALPTGTYTRESFGFLDGRIHWEFRMDLHEKADSPGEIVHDLMEYAKSRTSFVRDLLQQRHADSDPVVGPHRGGILMLNRRLQVEFRDQKTTQEDLAPNFAGSRF